jgi:hypothetical protein
LSVIPFNDEDEAIAVGNDVADQGIPAGQERMDFDGGRVPNPFVQR